MLILLTLILQEAVSIGMTIPSEIGPVKVKEK